MTVELTLTHLIFIVIALFSGFWTMVKVIVTQFKRESKEQSALMNARLDALNSGIKEDAGQWNRIERELLTLKAELPLHYVRREDYVQAIATIMTKLDAMAIRFENIILKGQSREL